MADETSVLQYLIGLSLDTKGWATSAATMERTADQQAKKEQERDKQSQASAAQYLGIQHQSTKEYDNSKVASDKLLESAKLRLVQEKLIQEQISTQELKAKQLLETQRKSSQAHGGGALSVGGFANPVVNSAASALGGSLGMAALTGGTAGAVMALSHSLAEAVGEIKHFVMESGPLQQQMQLFSQLAERNGKDAKQWVTELKAATMGLVDDSDLVKSVNKVMMQNAGLQADTLTKLIGVTTRFSRVQGKDASESMETLNRSLLRGRFQMLAFQLGVDKTTISELKRAEKLPATIKLQEQANILLEGMTKQLKGMDEPSATFSEAMKRIHVSTENMFEAIAAGITTGSGIGSLMDFLDKVSKWMDDHEEMFKTFGEYLSIGLSTIGSLAEATWDSIQALAAPLDLANNIAGFDILKTTLVGIAEAATLVARTFKQIQLGAQYLIDMTKMSVSEATDRLEAAEAAANKVSLDKLEKLNAALHPEEEKEKEKKPIAPPRVDPDFEKKMAKLQADIDKEALELTSENTRIEIEKRRQMYKDDYEAGKITTEESVSYNKALNDRLLQLDIQKIEKEKEVKLASLEDQTLAPEEEAKKKVQIAVQTELQLVKAREQTRQKNLAEDKREVDERMKLFKQMVDSTSKIQDNEATADKVRLQQLLDAYDDFYDQGKVSLQDWVDYRKKNNDTLMKMDLDNIERDKQAQLKVLDASKTPKEDRDQQAYDIEQKANADIAKIKEDYRKKNEVEDKKVETDKREAAQKSVANEQQIRATALAQAEKDNERSFSRQEMDAEDYLDQKREFIRQEQLDTIQAATQKYTVEKKTATSQMDLIAAVQKANADARQKNHDLDEQEAAVYIKDATERYNRNKELLESEQKNAALRSKATHELIASTEQYIKKLEDLAASSVIAVGTPEWEQLVKAIQTAKGELQGFNEEIQKTSTSLMGSVDAFSGFLSQHTKAGSWRHEALASALGATSSAGRAISGFESGAGQKFESGSLASRNLAAAVGESFKNLFAGKDEEGKNIGTFGERLSKVNDVLKDSFTVISAGIQAFQTRGAVQGGMAGAGFGGSVGGMLGEAFSALGPWGAVIGAGVGAVVGIFTGHAKAKVDKMADELTKSFTKVTTALQMGSITLSEAVKQQEALRAKTVADLSTSKEGRKQLKEILPQMDQQINQMLVQQQQTIKNLKDEMAVLNSPESFQSAVSSIEGIIAKYKEYAAAVSDTAMVQDYLNKSVAQYVSQQQKDLTSAERTAIQDAIDLNDQLQQRQDLLNETQKQEYDVLTQGVLTRQRTSAMTKGAQIAEIQKAADLQMKQLNQQIELSTYKVNTEKQIFSLATTRIDLEKQLLVMQKQQTDVEMKRLVALQVVTAALKTGTSVSDLNALMANFAKMSDSSIQDMLNNQYAIQARQGFGNVNGQF